MPLAAPVPEYTPALVRAQLPPPPVVQPGGGKVLLSNPSKAGGRACARIWPLTVSGDDGLVTPIPTLPVVVIRIASVPPALNTVGPPFAEATGPASWAAVMA